jgi:hypothetical protein
MGRGDLTYNMHVNSFQLRGRGFTLKKDKWNWTTEDEQQLEQALKDIAAKKLTITTQDPYYWIAFYVFHSRIPVKCIKAKILAMFPNENK